jgi:transcriptional regulator with XRE-family HTH domain
MSATALAKRAGISQTTLTRALNDRRHKFSLSVKTLEKIYQASGISPARFLGPGDWSKENLPLFHLSDTEPGVFSDITGPFSGGQKLNQTVIAGRIAAGQWREVSVLDVARFRTVNMRHSLYLPSECFVCVVDDDSVNKKAQSGEYLYCIRLDALETALGSESLVIVERRSDDGLKTELTARLLAAVDGGWTLSFATTNKKLKDVLKIKDLNSSKTRIMGRADFVFRPLSSSLF